MIEVSRLPISNPSSGSRHHVVLVHGTWGHGFWHSCLWPFLRHDRRQREVHWQPLCGCLADAGVTVHPDFTWSGRNSHRSRMRAGKELTAFIQSKTGGHDRVSIVAHSHGGLVALYSLRHLGATRVQAVVCLATPFLHFSPQPFDLKTFKWFPLAASYAGFMIGAGAWLVLWVTFLESLALSEVAVGEHWPGMRDRRRVCHVRHRSAHCIDTGISAPSCASDRSDVSAQAAARAATFDPANGWR
jgi:pimeloyl-ACP methyl ester carboxylesterase